MTVKQDSGMKHYAKSKLKGLLRVLPAEIACKLEYAQQSFQGFSERAIEYSFVFRHLASLCPKRVLDVGTGTTALPHLIRHCGSLVKATDNIRDYWPLGMSNRHYHVINDDITQTGIREEFDVITCVSVLEHIRDHGAAVRNMIGLLSEEGHLIMTFPYTESTYVRNVYELEGSNAYKKRIPFIAQSFSRREVSEWCAQNGCRVVEQEYWKCWDGDYWTVGRQVVPPLRVDAGVKHDLSCLLIQKSTL